VFLAVSGDDESFCVINTNFHWEDMDSYSGQG
jgi:hypothetical protein